MPVQTERPSFEELTEKHFSPGIPGLRLIDHNDKKALKQLAYRMATVPVFWDDSIVAAAKASDNPNLAVAYVFAQRYGNPYSLVFDLGDGAGVLAATNVRFGFRCHISMAVWDPRQWLKYKKHRLDILRACGIAIFLALDLLVVEAFIRKDNTAARKLAESIPMTNRGIVKRGSWYNGVGYDTVWYELTPDVLGL